MDVLKYQNIYNEAARQGCLFVFIEVQLITAAGLWSPLNNVLHFQIFLSFLSFFKTIGAGKIFGILCADLKHFSKTPCRRVSETTNTCTIKLIKYILDQIRTKDFLIIRTIDA